MKFKGINYNAGIDYNQTGEGKEINFGEFLSDLSRIKEMNCNSIRLYGSNNKKLLAYSKLALKNGFIVWASPRYVGKGQKETLTWLLELSSGLEEIRGEGRVYLVVGNEFTIDMAGLVPGQTHMEQPGNSTKTKSDRLNAILSEFVPQIRRAFGGKITYAAHHSEKVDFSLFDYIGLNYYWHCGNMLNYASNLENLVNKHNKGIIITEFGTCCYKFASLLGGGAYRPIQELKMHQKPILNLLIMRDENEQTRCLVRCFQGFERAGVEGTFVFDYAEKWKVHTPGKKGTDLASFGIMRGLSDGNVEPRPAYNYLRSYYGSR